jgi:hypothetical protein
MVQGFPVNKFALKGEGGGGAVSSVSNSDGSLTISPTAGAVIASLNLAHVNTWVGTQQFNQVNSASGSVLLDNSGNIYNPNLPGYYIATASGLHYPTNAVLADTFGNLYGADGAIRIAGNGEFNFSSVAGNGTHIDNSGNGYYSNAAQMFDAVGNLYGNGLALTGVSHAGEGVSQFSNDAGYLTSISGLDHNSLANLAVGDVHTQYALLAGRATPQQLSLGTASGASTGYISSTAHATKGKYFLNSAGTMTVDELNVRLGIGIASPTAIEHVVSAVPASVGTSPGTAATPFMLWAPGAGGNTTIATTGVGGAGATVTLASGNGGIASAAVTSATGGAGGAFSITSGAGGATSLASSNAKIGGIGAPITITGGAGGSATGTGTGANTAGSGAALTITAGIGGAAFNGSGSNTAGDGGSLTIKGGSPGFASSGGTAGTVFIYGGEAANPGATAGDIYLYGGLATAGGTGANGGSFNIVGASASGDNTVSRLGGNVSINAGAAKGDSTGGVVLITAGAGGAGTSTTGALGGSSTLAAGNGGVGSATGGTGGNAVISGGKGGDSTTDGVGGSIIFNTAGTITLSEAARITNGQNFGVGTGSTVSARVHSVSITEQLRLGYDASNYMSSTVGSTGAVTFDAVGAGAIFNFSDGVNITSSLQCDSIVNDTGLAAGTYTPTLSNTTNVAASTARPCSYMRVGNTVTVSGQFDIDPTTTLTATLLGVSLPIASALTTAFQLGGTANATAVAGMSAGIEADAVNDRASVKFIATDVSNQTMAFTFTYQVL